MTREALAEFKDYIKSCQGSYAEIIIKTSTGEVYEETVEDYMYEDGLDLENFVAIWCSGFDHLIPVEDVKEIMLKLREGDFYDEIENDSDEAVSQSETVNKKVTTSKKWEVVADV